ncbi:helix-turn-helix domain-containing protein [Candidatus Latescibacterota bacterium]
MQNALLWSMNVLNKFGDRIRSLRKEKSISQEKLAELADLHRTYIGAVERGERNISLINIKKIADALDISISQLMDL